MEKINRSEVAAESHPSFEEQHHKTNFKAPIKTYSKRVLKDLKAPPAKRQRVAGAELGSAALNCQIESSVKVVSKKRSISDYFEVKPRHRIPLSPPPSSDPPDQEVIVPSSPPSSPISLQSSPFAARRKFRPRRRLTTKPALPIIMDSTAPRDEDNSKNISKDFTPSAFHPDSHPPRKSYLGKDSPPALRHAAEGCNSSEEWSSSSDEQISYPGAIDIPNRGSSSLNRGPSSPNVPFAPSRRHFAPGWNDMSSSSSSSENMDSVPLNSVPVDAASMAASGSDLQATGSALSSSLATAGGIANDSHRSIQIFIHEFGDVGGTGSNIPAQTNVASGSDASTERISTNASVSGTAQSTRISEPSFDATLLAEEPSSVQLNPALLNSIRRGQLNHESETPANSYAAELEADANQGQVLINTGSPISAELGEGANSVQTTVNAGSRVSNRIGVAANLVQTRIINAFTGTIVHCDVCMQVYDSALWEDVEAHEDMHEYMVNGTPVGSLHLSSGGHVRILSPQDIDKPGCIVCVDSRSSECWKRLANDVINRHVNPSFGLNETDTSATLMCGPWANTALTAYLYIAGSPPGRASRIIGLLLVESITSACYCGMHPVEDKDESLPPSTGICEECDSDLSIPSLMGVNKLWVLPMRRNLGFAKELLNAARQNFIYGVEIRPDQIAWLDQSASSRSFVRHYAGVDDEN